MATGVVALFAAFRRAEFAVELRRESTCVGLVSDVPDCELEPNNVPCGPGRLSIRAMSISRTSTCCEFEVMGWSSRYTDTWLSVRYSAEPVEMPRITIELRPGIAAMRLTLGSAEMTSETLLSACSSMSVVDSAVTLCGTFCKFMSRRVAVTTTSSSRAESAFSCCANAAEAGYSTARIAAVTGETG
jgi:hypothetical protein